MRTASACGERGRSTPGLDWPFLMATGRRVTGRNTGVLRA
jgi:hypothetical protein